jgi:predicted metalloprotease with PDZ domain
MYAYHLTVPQGVTKLNIAMDFLAVSGGSFTAGGSTSNNLALLSWNTLIVAPHGVDPAKIMVTPSVMLPMYWKAGTALTPSDAPGTGTIEIARPGNGNSSGQLIHYAAVSMEQLIDSPVLAGRWFREIPLAPEITPKHFLDLAGDGPEDIKLSDEHIAEFSRLIRETGSLYKSRHYNSYHFLVTLSDQVAHFGLEHHQSSDDRVAEKTFVDDDQFIANGLLLPHEFTHSWNGKYRRPIGLATGNYEDPMKGNLLWVYEGLTEYLGDVLAARCGIWNNAIYRDRLATIAAYLNDARPGRTWRDLQDTATMAQILYTTGGAFDNFRRNTDFYDEGELLWLEVDLTIRSKTDGKKSLNDFAAAFHGLNGNTGPMVVPYDFDDVVKGLNAVVPNDWAAFLRTRLDSNDFHAPETAGIDALSGYKLTYSDKPDYWSQLTESSAGAGGIDARYSIGLEVDSNGIVQDAIVGGAAYKAGIAPGFHVVAVNGRGYSAALMHQALQDTVGNGPAVELIVENTGYYKTIRIDYHGGERYPHFERVPGTVDRLDDILAPMVK